MHRLPPFTITGVLLAMPLLTASALAQDAVRAEDDGDPGVYLAPVTVSAYKLEQLLNDMPASITVVDGGVTETKVSSSLRDVLQGTPNLEFLAGGGATDSSFAIRGITTHISFHDPSAPVFVDGVPMPAAQGIKELMDIEQVEILRGPQSANFGYNATAGAVNIVTRTPGATPEASATVGYGTNNRREVSARVQGPLLDGALRGSLSLQHHADDGFIDNVKTGNDVDDETVTLARLKLQGDVSDDLTLGLTLHGGDERLGTAYLIPDGQYTVSTDQDQYESRETAGGSLRADWQAGDVLVTSLTGVNTSTTDARFYIADLRYGHDQDMVSQELRVSGTAWSGTTWMVGAFGSYDEVHNDQFYDYSYMGFTSQFVTDLTTTQGAVFASVVQDLTDTLRLTVSDRLSLVKRDGMHEFRSNGVPTRTDFDETFGNNSLQASLEWEYLAGQNAYVTYAEGFKAGSPDFAGTDPAKTLLKTETSRSYEVGLKGRVLDDSLSYQAAAFHTTYRNMHSFGLDQWGIWTGANAPEAVSKGAEVEAQWQPADWLSFRGGIGYQYATFTEGPLKGNVAMHAPRWTGNLGTTVLVPLAAEVDGRLDVSYSYRSNFWSNNFNTPEAAHIKGYGLVDAAFAVDVSDITVSLVGQNLLDENYAHTRTGYGNWTPGDGRTVVLRVGATF